MRRSTAISLLMLFSWTLIAPFFAPDSHAILPACCRRNGKHHCSARMMGQLAGSQHGFTTVAEKCPYCPLNISSTNSPTYQANAACAFYINFVSYPSYAPQTEAQSRFSFLCSHQKRGPPLA
jgi:hypothetical protein